MKIFAVGLLALVAGLLIIVILTVSGVLLKWLPCGESLPRESWRKMVGKTVVGALEALDPDHTRYAPRYDERAFRSLIRGIVQGQVTARIGPPLSTRILESERVAWYYSEAGKLSDSYLIRVLVFDSHGVLKERHSDCYWD